MARSSIKLDERQLQLIKDNFELLCDRKDGRITSEQFSILYRSLGQTVSERELERIKQEYFIDDKENCNNNGASVETYNSADVKSCKDKKSGGITFEQFLQAFIANYKAPISELVLRQSFQIFDAENTGRISTVDFIELMCTRGEPLPKNEVDELLKIANVDRNKKDFDYIALAEKLYAGPGST